MRLSLRSASIAFTREIRPVADSGEAGVSNSLSDTDSLRAAGGRVATDGKSISRR
jgi:hypothetical protein